LVSGESVIGGATFRRITPIAACEKAEAWSPASSIESILSNSHRFSPADLTPAICLKNRSRHRLLLFQGFPSWIRDFRDLPMACTQLKVSELVTLFTSIDLRNFKSENLEMQSHNPMRFEGLVWEG